jgi:hypothetical protein
MRPKSNVCGWACATPTITVPADPRPAGPAVSLVDLFAEELSQCGDIAQASAAIRVPEGIGASLFEGICRRLGKQAQ